MNKRSDGFFLAELVIDLNCFGRTSYMNNDATLFQGRDGFSRYFAIAKHATRQDYFTYAMFQQLFSICRLNTGVVAGSSFVSIPLARSSRIQLDIFKMSIAFYLNFASSVAENFGGGGGGLHILTISD